MNAAQLSEVLLQGVRDGIAPHQAESPSHPYFTKVLPHFEDLAHAIGEIEYSADSLESFDAAARSLLDSLGVSPITFAWAMLARGTAGRDPSSAEVEELLPLLVKA